MRGSLLLFTLIAAARGLGAGEKRYHESRMEADRRRWHEQQQHYNKVPIDKIKDWTVHTDIDDSMYWYSRSMRRSIKEPPPGWKKNKSGKWVGPDEPKMKQEEDVPDWRAEL